MADIAELGLRITTRGMREGEQGLKKLGTQAEVTERQAEGVGMAVQRSAMQARAAGSQYEMAGGSVANRAV